MAIPMETTTITVWRPSAGTAAQDGYEPVTYEKFKTKVRAHISSGIRTGTGAEAGGEVSMLEKMLHCDPVGLKFDDEIEDDATGLRYRILWADWRRGLGLDHDVAGLTRQSGGVV